MRALARAVLVDVELHQYCRVKLVAALYAASYEIEQSTHGRLGPFKNTDVFSACQQMFVTIIERLFSVEVKQRMKMFGQYIILRLQNIYRMFGN